ncbi:MAG: hypothetical protein ACM3UU_07540 [Ignavibacteriales bacterium]
MSETGRDCYVGGLIFSVESALYRKNDVVIIGKDTDYEYCCDERIKFLDSIEAFKLWKEHNSAFDRILSYLGFKAPYNILRSKSLFLCPGDKKIKLKGTEESLLIKCGRQEINQIIGQLNENHKNGISGYEKFLLEMGRAAFGNAS